MRVPRIFTPQRLQADLCIQLESEASHHLLKVLRMKAGREIILFNGDGKEYLACINTCDKKIAHVKIHQVVDISRNSPLHTELAIGLSKGDRMDWVLQKASELGVSRIVPLFTERSEVKLSADRLQKKHQQWQKIIQSSCEQCQRNTLPQLLFPTHLTPYLQQSDSEKRFVLHHRNSETLNTESKAASVSILIGPEGGLTDTEITTAMQYDFKPLSLGPRVLRTETAPIAALSILQYCWGDFA